MLHVIENVVNVDRFPLQRPLVAEDLHAVDELADAVGLGADQLGQGAVAVEAVGFEKLRGAANARQWILDLVGEHGGEAGNGARRAAMGELPLDHLRHAALLQQHHHLPGRFWQRSAIEIDELRRLEPERAELHAVFVDCGAVALHLLDQRNQRAAECHDIGESMAAEHAGAHLKEVFGGGIGIFDGEALADHEQWMGQGAEHRLTGDCRRLGLTARATLFCRHIQNVYILAVLRDVAGQYLHKFYAVTTR